MVRAGISLPALMQLMGHADIETTLHYVQVSPQDVYLQYARATAQCITPCRGSPREAMAPTLRSSIHWRGFARAVESLSTAAQSCHRTQLQHRGARFSCLSPAPNYPSVYPASNSCTRDPAHPWMVGAHARTDPTAGHRTASDASSLCARF